MIWPRCFNSLERCLKLADFSSLFTDAKEANDMTGYQLVQYTGLFSR